MHVYLGWYVQNKGSKMIINRSMIYATPRKWKKEHGQLRRMLTLGVENIQVMSETKVNMHIDRNNEPQGSCLTNTDM